MYLQRVQGIIQLIDNVSKNWLLHNLPIKKDRIKDVRYNIYCTHL